MFAFYGLVLSDCGRKEDLLLLIIIIIIIDFLANCTAHSQSDLI